MKTKVLINVILLSIIFNISVFAQYSGGSGTEADPYQIATISDLVALSGNSSDWASNFIQTADIDASSTNDGGNGFSPIGNATTNFGGIYDGNGHTIDALYINRTASDNIALFGQTTETTIIKNLGLTNVSISGDNNVGALVGHLYYGKIIDCYSTGTVSGSGDNIGGLVGLFVGNNGSTMSISLSYSECTVSGGTSYYVGGFVGYTSALITSCYATGNVSGDTYVGGFAGGSIYSLTMDYATGTVTGGNYVGGFIGRNLKNIDLCHATGDVSNGNYVGGFVGNNNAGGTITNSYASGDISGISSLGGFAGQIYKSYVLNCYSLGSVLRESGYTDTHVGAFCGNYESDSKVVAQIYYSFAVGSVTYKDAANPTDKGFVGIQTGTNVAYRANYFDGDASNQTTGTGATSATTIDMQQVKRLYVDTAYPNSGLGSYAWDFDGTDYDDSYTDDYWKLDEDGGYPILVAKFSTSTNSVTSISNNSATSGGHIIYTGSERITERGICWSTSSSPTILDSKVTGNTSTNFSASLSGLSASTTYYVRAYVTNNEGTSYGDEESFTTTAALPVELTAFSANVNENSVVLNWQTATEVNNYGFEVERKPEAGEWIELGFIEGSGNSNSPKRYAFIDSKIEADKYFYRLKQVDIDGSFEYSNVIEIDVLDFPKEFNLLQNYPNPFNPSTQISFSIPEAGVVKLNIYNVLGEVVSELVNENLEAGFHQYQFNANNLTSGIYFYSISVNGFTRLKKMNLMK